MQALKEKNAKRAVCGGLVGLANSTFGGGGGMIAVPLLTKNGYGEKEAHATAILVILPISAFSFLLYVLHGLYDWSVIIPTALGVTLGGMFGAVLLNKLPVKTVKIVFAVLQVIAGGFLLFLR